MKPLTEFLNNDNDLYEINESLDTPMITLFMAQIAVLTGFVGGVIAADKLVSLWFGDPTIMDFINKWWKDRKAKNIAKKLAEDSDVQAFFQQSMSKQQSGWRKLLQSKLDESDYKYITGITKDRVKENIK